MQRFMELVQQVQDSEAQPEKVGSTVALQYTELQQPCGRPISPRH